MHHVHKISYFILIPSVLVSGLLLASYHQKYTEIKDDPEMYTQQSVQELISDVSKLMVLPENETPTVATVSDPAKLKELPFFEKAKAGDRLIIYMQARKAILYDAKENKILEVAPLMLNSDLKDALK